MHKTNINKYNMHDSISYELKLKQDKNKDNQEYSTTKIQDLQWFD